mgnify:FL=1
MWRWYLSKARHATRIPPKILRTAATDICRLHCSTARIRRKKAREVSIAGGDFRENFTNRSYLGKTNTAYNEADLDNILECRRAMGDKPVIVCATVNNPMVMHEFEAEADAIVAEFGVSRAAVLDVVFGGYNPTGRLPIQMPKDMDAVEEQSEDRALDMETYIDSEGHNYDYGYGMNYEGVLPAWKK